MRLHASPVAESLTEGHEESYLRYFFRNMAYAPDAIPLDHLEASVRDYKQPGAMRASFAYYRAFYESGQQNQAAGEKLTIPVLAIGGSASVAIMVEEEMKLVANHVTGAVKHLP